MGDFLFFWGMAFIPSTIAVATFKHEAATPEDEQVESAKEAYMTMYQLVRRPQVQKLSLHLFTRSLPFIPADVMAPGRLQDAGFPKESLAGIKLFVTPLEIAMPWILSPFTAGERPLNVVLFAYIPRVLLTLSVVLLLFQWVRSPIQCQARPTLLCLCSQSHRLW